MRIFNYLLLGLVAFTLPTLAGEKWLSKPFTVTSQQAELALETSGAKIDHKIQTCVTLQKADDCSDPLIQSPTLATDQTTTFYLTYTDPGVGGTSSPGLHVRFNQGGYTYCSIYMEGFHDYAFMYSSSDDKKCDIHSDSKSLTIKN